MDLQKPTYTQETHKIITYIYIYIYIYILCYGWITILVYMLGIPSRSISRIFVEINFVGMWLRSTVS